MGVIDPNTDRYEYQLFIDGEFTSSSGGESIEVSYPYNGEVWAVVPSGTADDIDTAVQAARACFENKWEGTLPSERRTVLNEIADTIDEYADELGELETKQNGKLYREMRPQMDAVSEHFRYYGRLCETAQEGRTIPVENKGGEMFNYTRKEPYGVVGAITPWNSPLLLSAWKLAPALAAGNTFVHKPSEETPVSALRFAELIHEHTSIPDGVYNVAPGYGHVAGEALTSHSDVDKLAFTGSTEIGREVAKSAGENLTKVYLELGGKSPNIVFPDADLDKAINGAMKGVFAATGQTCMAGSRILVHEAIADEFVERLAARTEEITLGDPMDPETQVGPVAFRDQWEKVNRYVEVGRDEATLVVGGEQPDDLPGECFIRPTVFADVDNDMQIAQEEIFGPVVSVIPFADETEALQFANDVDYGLAAAVWTEDTDRARRMTENIRAGIIWVNEYRVVSSQSPFGGYKDSGLGRENGYEGLEEYLQTKSIWYNHSDEVGDPFSLDAG